MSAQFASYEDVRKKVGSRTRGGWDDLLVNCGYHIKWWADPNARNGVQSQKEKVVFFPEHDDSGILRECFDTLDALIGKNFLGGTVGEKFFYTPFTFRLAWPSSSRANDAVACSPRIVVAEEPCTSFFVCTYCIHTDAFFSSFKPF